MVPGGPNVHDPRKWVNDLAKILDKIDQIECLFGGSWQWPRQL